MYDKFLYVTGCSFTAGTELYDYINPEFPGLIKRKDSHKPINDLTDSWLVRRTNYLDNLEISGLEKFCDFEKKLSWANVLAGEKSIPVFNGAVGASSQEAMVHRSIMHFANLKKLGIKPTHSIIQITSPYRFAFYRFKKGINHYSNIGQSFDASVLLNAEWDTTYLNLTNEIIKKEGAEGILLRNLTAIVTLRNFLLNKTGKIPIIVDAAKKFYDYKNLIDDSLYKISTDDREQLELLIEMSGFNEKIYCMSDFIYTFYTENDYTHSPGRHYSPDVNEKFGKFLSEEIGDWL